MIFKPSPIGSRTLTPEVLAADRKASRKFGPCGVGKEALYMGTNPYCNRRSGVASNLMSPRVIRLMLTR